MSQMIWVCNYQIEDIRSLERNNALSSVCAGSPYRSLDFMIICSRPVMLIPLCTFPFQPAPNDNKSGKTELCDTGLQINQ